MNVRWRGGMRDESLVHEFGELVGDEFARIIRVEILDAPQGPLGRGRHRAVEVSGELAEDVSGVGLAFEEIDKLEACVIVDKDHGVPVTVDESARSRGTVAALTAVREVSGVSLDGVRARHVGCASELRGSVGGERWERAGSLDAGVDAAMKERRRRVSAQAMHVRCGAALMDAGGELALRRVAGAIFVADVHAELVEARPALELEGDSVVRLSGVRDERIIAFRVAHVLERERHPVPAPVGDCDLHVTDPRAHDYGFVEAFDAVQPLSITVDSRRGRVAERFTEVGDPARLPRRALLRATIALPRTPESAVLERAHRRTMGVAEGGGEARIGDGGA
eukprot:4580083-Prymnesium_polylepis.1